MTTDFDNSAAPINKLLGFQEEQLLALELHEWVRLLEGLDRKPDPTEIKMGHDITTRIATYLVASMHARLAGTQSIPHPLEMRDPPVRAKRKRRSKGGGSHKLTAQRVVAPEIDTRIFATRAELAKKMTRDPGFTGWIDLENAGTIQGYTTGAGNHVWYKRAEVLEALRKEGLLK